MPAFGRSLQTACIAMAVVLGMAGALGAEESFKRFFPMLIELPGWTAEAPDGGSIEIVGQGMTSAGRKYAREDASLNAQILTGAAAQAALALTQQIRIETREARLTTETIDGFQVTRSFEKTSRAGAIIVQLSPAALFLLAHNGIPEDEAFALARKFDWQAMQAAVPK